MRLAARSISAAGLVLFLGVLVAVAGEPLPLRRLTDMTGRSLQTPLGPARILSFATSATDAIVRLGCGSRLVGVDEYSLIVPGAENVTVVAKGAALSREAVVASGADVAFVWWYEEDLAAALTDLEIPVFRIPSIGAAQTPGLLRAMGDCLGESERANELAESLDEFLSGEPASLTTPVKVYWEMYGPYKTAGAGSYADDLIRLAGGTNVATGCGKAGLVSPESLAVANPDVIFSVREFGSVDELKSRPALARSPAVMHGRVFAVDRLWLVAGLGLPDTVREVRALLELRP